ncbi:MAG: protein translocase subunit SecD [Candidatus Buchananbacteria bacterium]|jgi:protein-export membrane protein SecD
MPENYLTKFLKPGKRGRLRWVIFAIAIIFVLTAFIDILASKNIVAEKIDQGLSSIPLISDAKIFPQFEINSLDGTKRLGWRSIKQIDLTTYGMPFRLGLDLQGGAQLTYNADLSQIPIPDRKNSLEGTKDVIERRVNALGVSEPIVQTSMSGETPRISVELAGVYDINSAIKMIGETPLLEFKTENPEATKITPDQQKQLDTMNLDVRKKAVEVLDKVKSGADFAALAKQYSEDPGSKDNGGLYENVKKGQFVAEFDDVIFNKLQPGQTYQDLVKTSFGYHIIRLESVSGTGDAKTVNVRHILFKTKTGADLGIASQPEWLNTKLSGKNLKKATVEYDPTSMVPQVSLEFDNEGAQIFADLTTANVGKPIAIFLDGLAISTPKVDEPILGGKAVINGNFSAVEAKTLAQRLNAGALPVPVTLVSQQTVGATLGQVAVQKSLIAGFWGLVIVALFMILYYRLPGVLAVCALLVYTAISLAIFKIIPGFTFTLAGITGFILSIGMAVDANVLIFERLKEELKSGKELSKAIDDGFTRAWTSIRDSNASSLITCFILYWFGSSIIRGFALTLAIGILVSMFSAIVITRQFLLLVAKWKVSKIKFLYHIKK